MSYSKRQFVVGALTEIGLASYIFDMPADALQDCLYRLDELIADWNAKGIRIGYPIPTEQGGGDLDDDTSTPDSARRAIVANLAIEIAPMFGRDPSARTLVKAKQGYNTLMMKAAMPPQMQLPSTMPAGAGNKPWVWNDAFLQPPVDSLDAGADSELNF